MLSSAECDLAQASPVTFGQTKLYDPKPKEAQHMVRTRGTFGQLTLGTTMTLPVVCPPTLVPEADEVRLL